MKTNLTLALVLFLMLIFFPFIALIDGSASVKCTQITSAEADINTVTVFSDITGKTTRITAEDYVFGSVCAEMPASFHTEALKAQAVASYTYMKWLKENGDNTSFLGADITDSSSKHQAFITQEELREKWGDSFDIYSEKIRDAVNSVLYEYLVYENETAMTVYHALSPSVTHSAQEVWNSDLPYLQSVIAPGDKLSPDFCTEVKLTATEFASAFEGADKDNADEIFENAGKDEDGFVNELSFNGRSLRKTDIRSAFSLKSPYFRLKKDESCFIFTVYGKGHGIGMSQYSADYMARQGSTYEEILSHFYKGTDLVRVQ